MLAALTALANAAPADALKKKEVVLSGLDKVGATLAFVSTIAAVALLGAMAVWMIYHALTASQRLSTSWGPSQEHTFEPFAEAGQKIHSKAWVAAFAGAAVFAVVSIGIYFGVTPKEDVAAKSMDMSSFDKKSKPAAPAPTPAPAPAPAQP